MTMNVVAALTILAVIAQGESMTLKYASLVFRHGDRSPVTTYPNDPYKRKDWPQGYGQLSFNGTLQHFQLGRLIRRRYVEEHPLISHNYTRDEVYIHSTDTDRTLMSALSQLSGLFPPDEDQKLNGTIDWQPIPVHTVPVEDDNLLRPHGMNCPRYDQLLEENEQSEYYQQVNKDHEQFYKDVEASTGVSSLNVKNIWQIADTVFVEQQWGRNPGDWVNTIVSNTLRNLSNIDFALMFNEINAEEKRRLTAGNLVGQIVGRMQNKTINETVLIPGTRLVLYSAHDTTVAAFMSALQIFNNIQPPYAATVFVELYFEDSNSTYFVRLFYLNNHTIEGFDLTNTTSLLIPMNIPNCDQFCPLNKFIELTKDVIPSDWEKECQISNSNNNNEDTIIVISVVCGIGAILLVLILILLVTYVCRRRRRYTEIKHLQ